MNARSVTTELQVSLFICDGAVLKKTNKQIKVFEFEF